MSRNTQISLFHLKKCDSLDDAISADFWLCYSWNNIPIDMQRASFAEIRSVGDRFLFVVSFILLWHFTFDQCESLLRIRVIPGLQNQRHPS